MAAASSVFPLASPAMLRARDVSLSELLDAATLNDDALARNLADIRHINAALGWTAFTVRSVAQYVREQGLRSLSLLDVASGSADMPLAIAKWAKRSTTSFSLPNV